MAELTGWDAKRRNAAVIAAEITRVRPVARPTVGLEAAALDAMPAAAPAPRANLAAPAQATLPISNALRVVSLALATCILMVPMRGRVVGWYWEALLELRQVRWMLIAACYDIALVAGVALVALAALRLASSNRPRTQRAVCGTFAAFALFSLLAQAANIDVVPMLGRPLNYQWLHYSGFLMSTEARTAVFNTVSKQFVLLAIGSVVLVWPLGWVLRVALAGIARCARADVATALAAGLLGLYLGWSHCFLTLRNWSMPKLENPVWSFARSLVNVSHPALYTMQTTAGTEEFQTVAERRPAAAAAGVADGAPTTQPAPAVAAGGNQIRGVVVIVMESVAAQYLSVYGAPYDVTPNLARYKQHAATFNGLYAHAPSTNMSLVSMLCSSYPLVTYRAMTDERPDIPLVSIAQVLKGTGWRTGYFLSGDSVYGRAGEFIRHHGFDVQEDVHTRRCSIHPLLTTSKFEMLNTTDDMCTADSVINWVGEKPDQPFFALMWTGMTHFPYFIERPEEEVGTSDKYQKRYLNALRRTDEAISRVLDHLRDGGLLDSTLVVVVGDHGEAFAQHDTYGHASAVYDENLRVPLMLINPRLFHGEDHEIVGGMVDVSPTILAQLNVPLPDRWQGRDLFTRGPDGRVYFFAPWTDALFGYREGHMKVTYNATRNSWEVYDLKADPGEKKNLAGKQKALTKEAAQRLAAWVQYQDRYYEPWIKRK